MFEHKSIDCSCEGKFCKGCQMIVCIGNFWRQRGNKLRHRCIPCEKARQAQWREENDKYNKQRLQVWREANRDKIEEQWKTWSADHDRSEYHKTYRAANIDIVKAKDRRLGRSPQKRAYAKNRYQLHREAEIAAASNWRKHNPARYAANQAKRRTLKTKAGGFYTATQWEELKAQYDYTCLRCGRRVPEIKLTADHIVPVTKGGHSFISNIQPLCGSCNTSKGKKIIDFRPNWSNHGISHL